MEHLKNPAFLVSVGDAILTVGVSAYLYIQINKLRNEVEEVSKRMEGSEGRADKYRSLFVNLRKKQRTYDQVVQTVRELNTTIGMQRQTIHTLFGMMDHYSRCFTQIESELKKKNIALNLPPLPNMNYNQQQYGGMGGQQFGMPQQQQPYGAMGGQQQPFGMPQQPYGGMGGQQFGMPQQQPYGGQQYGMPMGGQQQPFGMPPQQPYGAPQQVDDIDDDELGL
jgi:hypothetical protein